MGLRMDIHNPSVPSNSSINADGSDGGNRKELMELIQRKDALEVELSGLAAVLQTHGVNMNTSLTTFDGYPRDDIDIGQIRTTRARIIHLRNDHKALMFEIEQGLHGLHATYHPTVPDTAPSDVQTSADSQVYKETADVKPVNTESIFAKVNSVVSNSPADLAGLKPGDGIVRFGDINFLNHANLTRVSSFVQSNQGKEIAVKVQRVDLKDATDHTFELVLIPRNNWGGRGLLGCHLLPA